MQADLQQGDLRLLLNIFVCAWAQALVFLPRACWWHQEHAEGSREASCRLEAPCAEAAGHKQHVCSDRSKALIMAPGCFLGVVHEPASAGSQCTPVPITPKATCTGIR